MGFLKVITENAWTEVTSNSQKQKANILLKVELEKRRIIFRREALLSQKSEADLMLVLNKALQKTGMPTYIWFSRVDYLQSGAISMLLKEKSSADQLVYNHLNMVADRQKSLIILIYFILQIGLCDCI